MSRPHAVDNSAAVSLFPFLAVLLCTMGALLVVLVAMTRSARDVALRQAAVHVQPVAVETDPANVERLDQVRQYLNSLSQVQAESERKLREEHQRLSHLEDHLRRLREQLHTMQIAALELETLEDEHYDDRQQAEREVARLQQLIAETRKAIESLKEEQSSKKRTYALVPYEGPNGTTRRPIYVECRKGELILQPEGIRLTDDDLRPPLGPGNPLAAALRAAREHWMTVHPQEAVDRDAEPYPLVIVRPSGATMFSPAQRAIQTGDFDFGYELVEEDWDLKYPPPDPQLAAIEQQAVDQARVRQQALAAAAPRAYRNPALAAAGRFEFDGIDGGMGFVEDGGTGSGGAGGGSYAGRGARSEYADADAALKADRSGGVTGGPLDAAPGGDEAGRNAGASPPRTAVEDGAGARGNGPPGGGMSGSGEAGNVASSGGAGGNQSSAGGGGGGQANVSIPANNQDVNSAGGDMELAASRGADWALKRKKPRAVPIRRTIQIVVRKDYVAILADDARLNAQTPAGKTISFTGDTVESIDDFVKVVNDQIEGWGMAGDGLYWRPVLALHVGPDGQRRAQDLARLLKNSGLELQSATTQSNPQGNNRATR